MYAQRSEVFFHYLIFCIA